MINQTNPFSCSYVFFIVDDDPERGLTTCAAELITAQDDVEAMEIATAVFALCNDAFHSYGLVHRDRIVAGGPYYPGQSSKQDVIKVHGRCDRKVSKLLASLVDDYPVLLRSTKLLTELALQRTQLEST